MPHRSTRFILRTDCGPFRAGEVVYLVRNAPTDGSKFYITESPSGSVFDTHRETRVALARTTLLRPFPFPPEEPERSSHGIWANEPSIDK